MAIDFDAWSESPRYGAGSTATWTHTLTTGGSRRLLWIFTEMFSTGLSNVSSITYGGVNLTYKHRHSVGDGRFELWYLLAPPTGANTVVVTWAGSASKGRAAGGSSWTGVAQSDSFGTLVSTVGSGGLSVNATSGSGEVVIDHYAQGGTVWITQTAGALQTLRGDYRTARDGDKGSHSSEEGAASVTMSWASSSGNNSALQAIPMKPAILGRDRLIKYFASTLDPKGRIFDNLGRVVPASLIEYDNWIRNEGPYFMTPKKHTSLIEADPIGYLEAIKFNERGRTQFITETETLLESLFRRLGARGA